MHAEVGARCADRQHEHTEITLTGQRQRVRHASSTSTAASVIDPMAWPLGKLKVVSGASDCHSDGRARP